MEQLVAVVLSMSVGCSLFGIGVFMTSRHDGRGPSLQAGARPPTHVRVIRQD